MRAIMEPYVQRFLRNTVNEELPCRLNRNHLDQSYFFLKSCYKQEEWFQDHKEVTENRSLDYLPYTENSHCVELLQSYIISRCSRTTIMQHRGKCSKRGTFKQIFYITDEADDIYGNESLVFLSVKIEITKQKQNQICLVHPKYFLRQ